MGSTASCKGVQQLSNRGGQGCVMPSIAFPRFFWRTTCRTQLQTQGQGVLAQFLKVASCSKSWMEKVEDGLNAQVGWDPLSLQVSGLPYTSELIIIKTRQCFFGFDLEGYNRIASIYMS